MSMKLRRILAAPFVYVGMIIFCIGLCFLGFKLALRIQATIRVALEDLQLQLNSGYKNE